MGILAASPEGYKFAATKASWRHGGIRKLWRAKVSCGANLDLNVLGEGVQRIEGSHFVEAILGSINHHPIVQTNDGPAARARADPREGGVNKAGEAP